MVRTNAPDAKNALDRRQPSPEAAGVEAEDAYFSTTVAPDYLPSIENDVQKFVATHSQKKIAIVTSGGTTVPLENNTVRFIDNFSAGTRGSASAEQFLEAGYAVIFLHREFSLMPYSRHFSHTRNFVDYFITGESGVQLKPEFEADIGAVLAKYSASQSRLLCIPFTTVNQYLYSLRSIATIVAPVAGPRALFYLAAAVSDFFLPQSKISEHKIQSRGKSTLSVELDPVPKFLRRLVEQWTPAAMVVSFKLETDRSILLSKCHQALDRYGHQLVIGNLLQTRKHEVVFVNSKETWVRCEEGEVEIEAVFVPEVVRAHDAFIAGSS